MDMEHKAVVAEVKALNEKGEGVLRFIRFNQEDKDSDITLPGFIGKQKAVLLASHNWKSDYPPLGSGESFEADGATNFRFRLNMNDERAKSWYSWLKMDRDSGLQQVSYGFSPYADGVEKWQKEGRSGRYLKPRKDSSPGAKLHEVSFVVVGSGNDTAIVDLKSTDELLKGNEQSVGPMKERHMQKEDPIVEPQPSAGTDADGSQDVATVDHEDWKNYSEEKRPPLDIFIKWLRGLNYHVKFIWDVRKRHGRDLSDEMVENFKDLAEEVLETCALLKISLMKAKLLPTMEEEELERQRRNEKYKELTTHKTQQEAQEQMQIQAQAEDLARAARARDAAMKQLKLK